MAVGLYKEILEAYQQHKDIFRINEMPKLTNEDKEIIKNLNPKQKRLFDLLLANRDCEAFRDADAIKYTLRYLSRQLNPEPMIYFD